MSRLTVHLRGLPASAWPGQVRALRLRFPGCDAVVRRACRRLGIDLYGAPLRPASNSTHAPPSSRPLPDILAASPCALPATLRLVIERKADNGRRPLVGYAFDGGKHTVPTLSSLGEVRIRRPVLPSERLDRRYFGPADQEKVGPETPWLDSLSRVLDELRLACSRGQECSQALALLVSDEYYGAGGMGMPVERLALLRLLVGLPGVSMEMAAAKDRRLIDFMRDTCDVAGLVRVPPSVIAWLETYPQSPEADAR